MSKKTPQNISASIRQKLLNRARQRQEDFQLALTQYALERLLFRLGQSKHAKHFVFKGAFTFLIWKDQPYWSTRDLDLLAFGESSMERIVMVFKDLCRSNQEDGLIFIADSVSAEEIREEQEYDGIRVTLTVRLEQAELPLQIDIGFGDVITPKPEMNLFPTLLDMPAPCILTYTKESVVAEKYETMVRFGIANSRMKDFYDVWVLAKEFDFSGHLLSSAIRATFDRRKTPLPKHEPFALSHDFAHDKAKQNQWKAFSSRTRLSIKPESLDDAIGLIRIFLLPPTESLAHDNKFTSAWKAGGPWSKD